MNAVEGIVRSFVVDAHGQRKRNARAAF